MNNLITLDQAKEQLRIVDTNDDTYITGLVSAASAVIVSYLKTPVAAAYDVTTDSTSATYPPMHVQQATLLVLASLYEDREGANDPIGVAVASILARDRDPAMV
jgi:hypothetical protein